MSPLRVRPENIKGYWPLFGASPETDHSGAGGNLTVTGATIADHAPVGPMFGFDTGLVLATAAAPPATDGLARMVFLTGDI